MNAGIELELITRQGCHLCDEASDVLAGVISQFSAEHPTVEYRIQTVDIDQDTELLEKYSDEVPVLLLNGKQIAFLRLDATRVFDRLVSMATNS